ncbi:hypothetical protein L6452_00163 [Arctium lappa]|uniref:Uncharacterized protein n=1 Tax=Arctium lappa TaxID=4217 RepID=A0ACB9FD34_ARCLA|nr:hypothetical protein L6452_00163 [Arctium lappa]
MELRTEARFLSLPQLNMQCLFLVVSAISFPIDEELRKNLSISGTILYILTYAIGAGPVTGLIIPELNSSRTRGKIMSFSLSVHWVSLSASNKSKASRFPHRPQRLDSMLLSAGDTSLESNDSPPEQVTEISLWERLGKAAMLNVPSSSFSWDMLSSLHHTEHSSNNDSEDDMNKALEARVIHNCSSEWLKIKEAAEKAREAAVSDGDEVGDMTCSELIEALELSRCLYLMKYI